MIYCPPIHVNNSSPHLRPHTPTKWQLLEPNPLSLFCWVCKWEKQSYRAIFKGTLPIIKILLVYNYSNILTLIWNNNRILLFRVSLVKFKVKMLLYRISRVKEKERKWVGVLFVCMRPRGHRLRHQIPQHLYTCF